MDYPATMKATWIDDDTGSVVGEHGYIRDDIFILFLERLMHATEQQDALSDAASAAISKAVDDAFSALKE